VAYEIRIDPQVVEYISASERLTESDRDRIFAGLTEELGEAADRFAERNPIAHFDNLFWYTYGLMTEAREYRHFWFACNAAGHVYGVTEVLYAEERSEEGGD
jgi:hypothetical protein